MIGMPTAAVSRRTLRLERPFFSAAGSVGSDMKAGGESGRVDQRPFRSRTWYPPKAPFARLICLDRFEEIALDEVGPERVREEKLRVGGCPEKEVADPKLAARTDE